MEICKYCNKNEAIKNSHIIPSFVYEWVKSTAPTRFLRATHEPNVRLQDGSKSALLCLYCEQKFSKIEDEFKSQYFSKVANYRKPCPEKIEITQSVLKCIYIMAWRSLADTVYFPKENDYKDEEIKEFPSLLEEIKKSIENNDFLAFKTHLIPCVKKVLLRLNFPQVPWHMYERSVTSEARIWNNWLRFILYIQIPFSIIVFEIVPNEDDPWVGTQLSEGEHLELTKIESAPQYISTLIEHFYEQFLESKNKMSTVQIKRIEDDLKNADPNCGAFKSMNKYW
ncbi:TPA: hypothetical protein ACSTNG_002585 [Serratia fonticola]